MADDKLIYPIGFDLKAAVDKAAEEWDSTYAAKLERKIQARPLNVKLKLSEDGLANLDDVKRRLAEIKIEPLTAETKTAIRELTRELEALARALEKVSQYSVSSVGTSAVRGARVDKYEAQAAAARELARQRAARAAAAESKLEIARLRAAAAADRAAAATRNANREYKAQDGYISRLVKRLAVYAGFRQISNFLTSVREVTAQFELQRVSLGAIIQDQQRANQLFAEIKSFALKSPVSILDLTKYTKQLAAYKIGVDELFETTKKLTDVSVGLGVSMDRVVLAYGQTRATGYLRASEIRQFTEMGVPIVEELAKKLSQMNGELVTAAQVMDMVSKKAISFELVKDVFDDMTSAGGIFYNMQEKQGETLFGLWAKLGDAASVMYDEIGNTDTVNSAMKGAIDLLTDLMRNWREVGRAMGAAGVGFAALWATKKVKGWQGGIENAAVAARQKATAAEYAYARAVETSNAARLKNNQVEMQSARIREAQALSALKAARAEMVAANATTLWSKAWNNLKAAFLGNWMTLLIAGLATLAMYIYNAHEKANRLKNTLAEINAKGEIEQSQSVNNFKALADAAVNAADGSKQQSDALEELHRTYGNMIPIQDMTIEKLRALNGEYHSLTDAIREYIAQQNLQEKMSAIYNDYGKDVEDARKDLLKYLQTVKVAGKNIGENQARRIIGKLKEVIEAGKSSKEAIKEAFEAEGIAVNVEYLHKATNAVGNYTKNLVLMNRAINDVKNETKDSLGSLGKYTDAWEAATTNMKNFSSKTDKNSFLYTREKLNSDVGNLNSFIKTLFAAENLIYDESAFGKFVNDVDKNGEEVSVLFWDKINAAAEKGSAQLKKALEKAQDTYNKAVPSDQVINLINAKLIQIATETGAGMDKMRKYWMSDGADISAAVKNVKSNLDELLNKQIQWNKLNAEHQQYGLPGKTKGEMEGLSNEIKAVQMLLMLLQQLVQPKTNGRTSDNRLSQLNEIEQTLTKINQKYEELRKKEGDTKALEDVKKIYGDTLDYVNKLGERFGLAFDMPTDLKTLNEYRNAIKKVIETLKMQGYEKAALELQTKIDTGNVDEMQKQIEKQLKDLADRISRTKTAKEFYEKILSQTGDIDLAANVTMSIYGDAGEGLFDATVEQIKEAFKNNKGDVIDVGMAIDFINQRIDYGKLAEIYEQYQGEMLESTKQTAEKIVSEGQKTAASNVLTWQKELEKAKSFEQQRTDIIDRETQRRAEIIKSNLPQEEKDRLTQASRNKQSEDIANLNFKEFKESEDYIKIFENLDNVSTAALKRLKENIQEVIKANKDLSPENMKTLVKAMEDIDEQISGRGFGNDMVQSVKDYISAVRELKTARTELVETQAEYDAQLPELDAAIQAAEDNRIDAQLELNVLKESGLATENEIVAAELKLNQAEAEVTKAEDAKAKAANKVKDAEAKVTGYQDKQQKASKKFVADMRKTAQTADQLAGLLRDVADLLGISSDSAAGLAFDSAISSLEKMSAAINICAAAQAVFNTLAKANPYIAIGAGVLAVGAAITSWISGNKVRKANKEIAKQQKILDNLEYTYSRLQKAADKLFGKDYIDNFNRQQRNLEKQAEAYQKQLEAERSKGKKADEEKLKEYEKAYKETLDEIADMQSKLSEHFAGTSRESAARQMAQDWLEARASMDDTFKAIYGSYANMIKNMIVEGAAARVIENALAPMWEKMDAMLAKNDIDGAIEALVNGMDDALDSANKGMEVLWKSLEARGFDMKKLIGDVDSNYTGIKREVAGATSEEMNANTAALNTQNYYVSHLPAIAENVAAIRQFVENGNVSALPDSATGWTDWQRQAMDHYAAIQRNTADTVVECRRIAERCTAIAEDVHRVVRPKGVQSTHGIQVYMS